MKGPLLRPFVSSGVGLYGLPRCLAKKLLGARVEVNHVPGRIEAMCLVAVDLVVEGFARFLHGIAEPGAVDQRHAPVAPAHRQHHCGLDLVGISGWRRRIELCPVRLMIADAAFEVSIQMVRYAAVSDQLTVCSRPKVSHCDIGVAATPEVGSARALAARRSPVAATEQAHSIPIDDTLLHQIQRAIGDVVLHRQAPLLHRAKVMLFAEACGPARLGLKDCVAARRQNSGVGRRPRQTMVTTYPGTTVYMHNQRQVLGLSAARQVSHAGMCSPSRAV